MPHENNQPFVSDARLLRRFTREGAQAAFAALVSRHSRLVYSVCLRDVGNATVAEDAAQAVFLLLARKAPALHGDGSLAGWLYRTARLVSKNALRREQRVRQKEQRAAQHMAQETQAAQDALWERINPVLHTALDALGRVEREAVLLRCWDGLSLAETGAALGLSEDAARMRVTRALEKLKRFLVKEGVVLTASVLAGLLAEKSARAVPVTPAHSASPNAHHLAQGATRTMWITKASIMAALVAASLGGIWGARTVKPHTSSPPTVLQPATASVMDPQAQAVITQATSATATLNTLRADVTAIVTSHGKRSVQKGTLAFERSNRMHVTFAGPDGSTAVSDGTYCWNFYPSIRKVYKFEASPDGRELNTDDETLPFVSFFFDPSLTGLHVEPDNDQPIVSYANEETWQGVRCQVVKLTFQKLMRHTLHAYFGPDHLLRRCVWTTYFGSSTRTDDVFLSN
ncbi:MAG: sigma-70 family RNA polymerase sigma factor, partial [Armatimonadota bacterium]|nr:sigma-70 family RNA polymerase sigma factor [Armatimonadota bacterium]